MLSLETIDPQACAEAWGLSKPILYTTADWRDSSPAETGYFSPKAHPRAGVKIWLSPDLIRTGRTDRGRGPAGGDRGTALVIYSHECAHYLLERDWEEWRRHGLAFAALFAFLLLRLGIEPDDLLHDYDVHELAMREFPGRSLEQAQTQALRHALKHARKWAANDEISAPEAADLAIDLTIYQRNRDERRAEFWDQVVIGGGLGVLVSTAVWLYFV